MAEAQFGSLLEDQGARLVGEDIDGTSYDLKFRFWTNNQSRMYLIEGCSDLLKKYKLGFGDVIVFARKADGALVIGGRPCGPVRSLHASSDFPSVWRAERHRLLTFGRGRAHASAERAAYGVRSVIVCMVGVQQICMLVPQQSCRAKASCTVRSASAVAQSGLQAGAGALQEDSAKRPVSRARTSGKGEAGMRAGKKRKEAPTTGAGRVALSCSFCVRLLASNHS